MLLRRWHRHSSRPLSTKTTSQRTKRKALAAKSPLGNPSPFAPNVMMMLPAAKAEAEKPFPEKKNSWILKKIVGFFKKKKVGF